MSFSECIWPIYPLFSLSPEWVQTIVKCMIEVYLHGKVWVCWEEILPALDHLPWIVKLMINKIKGVCAILLGFLEHFYVPINFLGIYLYSFPRATVTNYHKLDGLTCQKYILSQFWTQEIQNQILSDYFPLEALEEISSLPFLVLVLWLHCSNSASIFNMAFFTPLLSQLDVFLYKNSYHWI